MPRPLDADARRAEVVTALWRVAAREGLGAATARGVAAEAGLSLGAVTRVFPDQEALHVAAMGQVLAQVRERVVHHVATDDPVADAEAGLLEAMPLDPVTVAEASVYYSYLERARTSPALRAVADEVDDALLRLCRHVVTTVLAASPSGSPSGDEELLVRELHALTEGLAFGLVTWPGRRDAEEVRRVLRAWLGRLREWRP